MAAKPQNSCTVELNTVELPPCIEIKDSSVISGMPGAFSKMLIPTDTRFGPYKGEIINPGQKSFIDYRFAWEVFEKNSNVLKHTINAMEPRNSNWMRHVNNARFYEEQNIISTQDGYSIYYVAMKDIKPGEELLTWFDPKLLKRTKRRLSKMERKPVGYTIELVPWSDEKKFVPEIIETKRARKKKVLSDMISLDENPLILTRTLQRLSKLPCTPKQLAQSSYRGSTTSEHKNVGFEASKSRTFDNSYIFQTAKTTSIPSVQGIVKCSPTKKHMGSLNILGHNTKPTHHGPSEGKMVPGNKSVCLALDTAIHEKGNSQLSPHSISGSFLKMKKMKGKTNVDLLRKSTIRIGKFGHQHSFGGELVYGGFTLVKPIVYTQNKDGSTTVEDHDETFMLSNVELMPECDDKCLCIVNKKSASQPSGEAKQGNFVIQFTLLPEHKSISPDNKIILRCDICDSAYNHAFSLKRHYLRVHVNHRYLSREDIVSCQIETFHTDIELNSKEFQSETLTLTEECLKSSLLEEQLSVPKNNLSDFDQTDSVDVPAVCIDKLQEKTIMQDNLEELGECRDERKITCDSDMAVIERAPEFTSVPSLSNLAQILLDKATASHAAKSSSPPTTVYEHNHSSATDNNLHLNCDESMASLQQYPIALEANCANESAEPENVCDNNKNADGDVMQHEKKPDLMLAEVDESSCSQNMSDVCNGGITMLDSPSSAGTVENIIQIATCEAVEPATVDSDYSIEPATVDSDYSIETATVDSDYSIAVSKTSLHINPETSEQCFTSDSSSTQVNSLVSSDSYAEGSTSTSDLSLNELNYNINVEETNGITESIDPICETLSPDHIFEEDIYNNAENNILCSQLNESETVTCTSTVDAQNGIEDVLSPIVTCSDALLMETNPVVLQSKISGEMETSESVMIGDADTSCSDVTVGNNESIVLPIKSSHNSPREISKQHLTLDELEDCSLRGINSETHSTLITNEMTAISNNQDNISHATEDLPDSVSPIISQQSPSTCKTEISNLDQKLQVASHSSEVPENIEKFERDINLPEKSTLQTILSCPVSVSSTTSSITTSSAVTQSQPPQQLIFVTNLVFPVVSPGQKQMQNSISPLSLAVSQSSTLVSSQAAMSGLTTSVPLVVISQVPCGLSAQNAANAFLQSSTALKTLQSIKHSLNVLNLGNTPSGLRSLLPSGSKSNIATVVCGNSANSVPSTRNAATITSSSKYCCPSKSGYMTSKPFKPGTILNYSSPQTSVSSLVYSPQLPISTTGSTKSVAVIKTLTPVSSFLSPQKDHTHLGAQPDDLYRCHMCVLVFKTMSELKFHIRNDPHRFKGGIKQYACLQCSMRFSNKNNLMRHNLMNHPESENFKFRCFTCGKGFMCETYLKMHARFHSGKNFPCKYGCVDKFFPNAASLVKHLRAQHAGLDLKEYLRNAKAEKSGRKKGNSIFQVINGQINSLGSEVKTLSTIKPAVSSLVKYSLNQPGLGFQAKRGHTKNSKHPSNDISVVFSKVEDKSVGTHKVEFLSKVNDSQSNEEQNNNLRYECHLCLQRLGSHLKLLQHRTQKHGMSQSVQEYLYQMSKDTVEEEISETGCVKLEFSPPPSPKTFFDNVNRRSYENMSHYIDGSCESLEVWQKNLIVKDSITKWDQGLTSASKEKLEWTVFNFPLCFEYKEDCTKFYDRVTELDAVHNLPKEPMEGEKQKDALNVCDVAGIKVEMHTLGDTLQCKESDNEEMLNECTPVLSPGDKNVFSSKNSQEDNLFVGKLQPEVTNYNEKTIKQEVKHSSDCMSSDISLEVDNCEVVDNKVNVTDELSQSIICPHDDDDVDNDGSKLDYSRSGDSVKCESCSPTCDEEISNTSERDNYFLCSFIVDGLVSSAVMASKNMTQVEHPAQSACHGNDEVNIFQSGGFEETLEAGNSVLDKVPDIHDIKVDEIRNENNTLMAPVTCETVTAPATCEIVIAPGTCETETEPVICDTITKAAQNQHRTINLSAKEKLEALTSQYIQGLHLAISELQSHDYMTSLSSRDVRLKNKLFVSRNLQSSMLSLEALDLHITENQLLSNLFQKEICSNMEKVPSLMGSINRTLSGPMLMSESKMSYSRFDHADGGSLNTSDTSKHDHKRYSIWAGQVQQNFHNAKEEAFCQPVTEAVRKQEVIQQQVKYQFDKSERYKEMTDKSESTLKINFAEELGLMTRKEFDLSYHPKKQHEFVIKVPEVWDNYENIWFGKKGNIAVVCSICHRHFSCWDLCFRHQLKKHPHIEPASLEMEKDNYVEDMYYYYPMPYGILAQTHLIPDNLPVPEVYVCTKCGFPFKNLSRLHAHIIVCGPAQEGTTSRQSGNLKKPSYMKKKLLPIMSRRLYQNLEPSKPKVRPAVKNVVYPRSPSMESKYSTSFLAQEKGNKLSLSPDNILSSSVQSRSGYSAPFSFYSGRKRKSYELLYNPQNHTRRRELYKVLEQHQCHGCNLKFNSLYMLEKHVNKCSGRDKLQSQKPLLSGIMPDDAAVRKQHTCRYCNKRFTHIKGVDLHYKRICAVRKVKEEENQLTEEDLAHEEELKRIIEHIKWSKSLNKDSSDIIQGHVIVEEDGTLTRVVKQQDSPQSLKKKVKKKTSKWTTLKRHRLDEDSSVASSSTQSSPVIPAENRRLVGDTKASEKFDGILGASRQTRLTRSTNHEVVNKKCGTASKRQASTGGGSLRNKDRTVSPLNVTGVGGSRIKMSSASTQNKKNNSKKSKSKKGRVNKGNSSENIQNEAKSTRNSRDNVNEGCSLSGTSTKSSRAAAAPTGSVSICIKPPARKRGKPQKFDPSDMESSYKKTKKCEQDYVSNQRKTDSAKNDSNGRKRSRPDASLEGSSQKKPKTEVKVKACESYLLRNKSPRVVLERAIVPYTQVDKCDSSKKENTPEMKKDHNVESSKLLVKMKQFKESTKSKRNKLHGRKKSPSSHAQGNMLNNKEESQSYFSKKVSADSKSDKKCSKLVKKTPSSELLKHLTEDKELLKINNPSERSVSMGKRALSATSHQGESKTSLKGKCTPGKRLKITTLNSGCKSSAGSPSPFSKAPMITTNSSPVISGLRTLAKTTLGKATLRLEGGESRNNVIKSSLVTLPVMSPCSLVTSSASSSSVASSSQSSKGMLSKPTSPIFKPSTAPVRIVTLSPNGNNLLTYDSADDIPQSSLLMAKATNSGHGSPTIINVSPKSVPVTTKLSLNVQPQELLKIIHDPNREKHSAPISDISRIVHIDHAQVKAATKMKEPIVHITSHSNAFHKGLVYKTSVSDSLDKSKLTSHMVDGCEDKVIEHSTEYLKPDNKSDAELATREMAENCTKNNATIENVRVAAITSSCDSTTTGGSDEAIPKLSVKRAFKLSLDGEILSQGTTEQVIRKEMCTTTSDKTLVGQTQNVVNCKPHTCISTQHISHCQNGQNTVRKMTNLVQSVNPSGLLSSHKTPVQTTCPSKFHIAKSSTSAKSHEAVSAIIIPSTAIKAQVPVPRATSTTAATSITFPTRFGSPAKIVTVTGGVIPTVIQGGTVQAGTRILKLGSPRSIIAPAQVTNIRAHCQQIPTAVMKKMLPLSTSVLPKLVATGIRTQHLSAQPSVSKTTSAHSLLNITTNQTNVTTHLVTNQTNVTTHLVTNKQSTKNLPQQLCVPQPTFINNVLTVSQPLRPASTGGSVSASSIKANKPSQASVTAPSNTLAPNQIMFSLEDGTTAMLDPDSLAQFLSLSPSLNKTDICSVPSVINGTSVDKSATDLITETQLNQSDGDGINWPSNGTVDLTDLSDISFE